MAHIIFNKNLPSIKQLSQILATESMKRSHNNQDIAAKKMGISKKCLEMILHGQNISLLKIS